jgi:acetolactate synthase small subunit
MSGRLHTIVALVEDRPGVLNKIASKWRQRAFNIESLTVGHSEVPGLSRMTFTVDGAARSRSVWIDCSRSPRAGWVVDAPVESP